MTNAEAAILGAIQGVSEWLPISETSHVNLAPSLFGWRFIAAPFTAFRAIMQSGTLLAALLYFHKDILRILLPSANTDPDELSSGGVGRLLIPIVIGSLPAIVLELFLRSRAQVWEGHWMAVAAGMILLGILFIHADGRCAIGRKMSSVSVVDGLIVGIGQAIGMAPGISAPSSSLFLSMELGFERTVAAKFAFLMYLPAYTLFTVLDILSYRGIIITNHLTHAVLLASAVAFVVGYISLAALMQFLRSHSIYAFAIYRIIAGGAIVWLFWRHLIR